MRFSEICKKIYFWSTGYSYTNLGRLFLRLFTGLMLIQFGIRQIINFASDSAIFPSILGLSPEGSCILMIVIEITCSLFIMAGFMTRLMIIPPFIAMVIGEIYTLTVLTHGVAPYTLSWMKPGYLPVMFLGIFFFMLLVGPGKISVDYFLSLHIIHTDNKSESELEEV